MTNSPSLWHVAGLSAITSAVVTSAVFLSMPRQETQGAPPVNAAAINADPNETDSSVVQIVELAEPAVVSVIISKDVPVMEQSFETIPGGPFGFQIPRYVQRGTEEREVGGGTAFFVSADGLLMTNKHVVDDPEASYTVFLNDGRKLEAKVVGRDPANDIALLKVEGKDFPYLEFSADSEPKLGQTVIAIGNALAEFRNTVSVGVVSGLGRSILAGGLGDGSVEQLNSIIQTDAAINQGNSGGPLLDLHGKVIGMSTAVASGAQNIGFALPAADLQQVLTGYTRFGRIVRPYLGVRYVPVTPQLQQARNLPFDYGVLIDTNDVTAPAILPNSPAEKAGLKEGDIILTVDNQKLTLDSPLAEFIARKAPGDQLKLRIARNGEEMDVTATLEERGEG